MTGARETLDVPHEIRRDGRWPGSRNRPLLPAAGDLALAGILLVLLNTRLGAYLSDDTYYYIYPARDLLAGKGFHPSYIFAPLFPMVLAGISLFGDRGVGRGALAERDPVWGEYLPGGPRWRSERARRQPFLCWPPGWCCCRTWSLKRTVGR